MKSFRYVEQSYQVSLDLLNIVIKRHKIRWTELSKVIFTVEKIVIESSKLT